MTHRSISSPRGKRSLPLGHRCRKRRVSLSPADEQTIAWRMAERHLGRSAAIRSFIRESTPAVPPA